MKTFSVAVAVAVVLTFICVQQSSAVPVTEEQELEEPMSMDYPAAAHEQILVDSWKMPFDIGENRDTSPVRCHHCCDCCLLSGCGICCQ
ncbi:hepcidin-like isoform X2 [Neolamprologus brichardi]|uniref:hepcidin-like isoform X2 n=1 Tax=Neolamprologus brichardi TaxID=32507 RepID=UPI0016439ED4|nr:hepcidin-like isoform X2 [Neolamprologus brichardi]